MKAKIFIGILLLIVFTFTVHFFLYPRNNFMINIAVITNNYTKAIVDRVRGQIYSNTFQMKTHYRPNQITLEKLHKQIQSQIQSLQEYGDCDKGKVLICKNERMYAGFGSMTTRYGMCMQIAFGLGRIAIIFEERYEHFGNYAHFFDYLPDGCSYKKSISSKSICYLRDPKCYINGGYEVNNTYQVLVFGSEAPYSPYPRHIPGTLPLELETSLKENDIEDPWMWFTSQFFGYLLLRIKPYVKNLVESFRKEMNLTDPFVALHIRYGDKILGESRYVSEEKYVLMAEKFFNKLPKSNSSRKIFVASDQNDIVRKLSSLRPEYDFVGLQDKYLGKFTLYANKDKVADTAYFHNFFPMEVIESMVIDYQFLAYANYTICTFTSNVCRLVYSLKATIPPYTFKGRIYSMDQEHDPGVFSTVADPERLAHFFAWSYTYPPPCPYWVTIGSSPSVSVSGDFVVGPYNAGRRVCTQGDRRDVIPLGHNEIDPIIFVMTREIQNYYDTRYPKISQYVFVKDLRPWPGRPLYHFYK